MTDFHWPETRWRVRHGQSAGNVARDEAEAASRPWIDIASRDVDVPLSALGEQQSTALGTWFSLMSESDRPTAILSSPYLRAKQTVRFLAEHAALDRGEIVHRADE